MLNIIDGLPPGAIGFVASETIGPDERHAVLEPSIAEALEGGRINLVYVLDSQFGGYDLGFPFDDVVFGTRHFTDFERIAFVADDGPFRRVVAALADLMPGKVRVFALQDVEAAKTWIADELDQPKDSTPQARSELPDWFRHHL
jgi:hypothetical protein